MKEYKQLNKPESKIKTLGFLLIFFILFLYSSAVVFAQPSKVIPELKIIILGNSNPVSPFKKIPKRVHLILKKIKEINPDFIFHTGNIVFAGKKWMGVRTADVSQQYLDFFSLVNNMELKIFYTPGKKDFFDNKASFFKTFTKQNLNYSFNYGKTHFVIINTATNNKTKIKKWLLKDLQNNYKQKKIILVTHKSFFYPYAKNHIKKKFLYIHKILKSFAGYIVISGEGHLFYKNSLDNIQYINFGCAGYNKDDRYKKRNQFYLLQIKGSELSVEKFSFPYKKKTNFYP